MEKCVKSELKEISGVQTWQSLRKRMMFKELWTGDWFPWHLGFSLCSLGWAQVLA